MQPEHLNIAVLVSEGRHPVSGRARRALQDACALEVAFALGGELEVIHAGDPERPALQDYLGMGLPRMTVLRQGQDDDALSVLAPYLDERQPDLLLTGIHAEQGEGSGMLPYLLAEHLGWPLVTGIAAVESIEGDEVTLLQALPRGQRRRITARLPLVASVDEAAASPRQLAFARARRGAITEQLPVAPRRDAESHGWQWQDARPRPKRLKVARAKTAADRFKQATAKAQGGKGQIIRDDPQAAAQAIYDLLVEEGVLRK
ncbi:electron transfer flavoprotein subunit beta [Oceanimonas doudoroffii]|uniref:Electron transfer flavoprotein subunit beta n=1 Tax=Oceanimonas doudoroffii TaxID=84158 RepID=A0A233RFJ7_9GAMM|nr:electron transfer flavoprotein subunit beta [Oceanimonas doudoroffii]OXY82149.1 electron transfer flavoprotein subunit beta [Oceanimonas doudoroffii]